MNVSDLVIELPFGREWFVKNSWLANSTVGIITRVINHETVVVLWSTGKVNEMDVNYLGKFI